MLWGAPTTRNPFQGCRSFVTSFFASTAGFLRAVCQALKASAEFLIQRENTDCGGFDRDGSTDSSGSAQECGVLCPAAVGSGVPGCCCCQRLRTLFNWFATCLSAALRAEMWPVHCNFGKGLFLVLKALKCSQTQGAVTPLHCCSCTGEEYR